MARVVLFGHPQLSCANGAVKLPTKQCYGLLSILCHSDSLRDRHELAGTLWGIPVSPAALHRLSQVVYELKRLLPPNSVITTSSSIGINHHVLDSDVRRFRIAFRGGEYHAAMIEYGAPFLEGFSVSSSFDEWKDDVSAEFAKEAAQALKYIILQSELRSDLEVMLPAAQRLRDIDPYSTIAALAEAKCLAINGHRWLAVERLNEFASQFQSEMGAKIPDEISSLRHSLVSDFPPTQAFAHSSGRYFGRYDELARLISNWDSSCNGRVNVTVIAGASGVGKTRLAEQAARVAVLRGGRAIVVKCNESDQRIPYCLAAAIISGIPSEHIRDLSETWQSALQYICPELANGNNTDRNVGWSNRSLGKALAEALEGFARKSPVMILVDDVHWADKTSADLLAYAIRQITTSAVCVIVTRTDGEGAAHSDAFGHGYDQHIALGPLDDESMVSIAEDIDYTQDTSRSTAERTRLVRYASGNPLFLIELCRDAKGRSTLFQPTTTDAVPAAIDSVLVRQTRRLSPVALRILRVLCVIDADCTNRQLRIIARTSQQDIATAIDELLSNGMVSQYRRRVRLRHDLLRRSVYSHTGINTRRLYHLRVLRLLKQSNEEIGRLVHHAHAAGARRSAYSHSIEAGRIAIQKGALAEAEYYLRLALKSSSNKRQRIKAAEELLSLLSSVRRYAEAKHLIGPLRRHYVKSQDDLGVFKCDYVQTCHDFESCAPSVASMSETLTELAQRAAALDDSDSVPQLLRILAELAQHKGQSAYLASFIPSVVAMSASRSGKCRCDLLGVAAIAECLHGSRANGLQYAEEAVEIARAGQWLPELSTALTARGIVSLAHGSLPQAELDFDLALKTAADPLLSSIAGFTRLHRALVRLECQQFDLAESDLKFVLSDPNRHPIFAISNLAVLAFERGSREEATLYATRLLSENESLRAKWVTAFARTISGLANAAAGDWQAATRDAAFVATQLEDNSIVLTDRSYSAILVARAAAHEGRVGDGLSLVEAEAQRASRSDALASMRMQVEYADLLSRISPEKAFACATDVFNAASSVGATLIASRASTLRERLRAL